MKKAALWKAAKKALENQGLNRLLDIIFINWLRGCCFSKKYYQEGIPWL